MKQVKKLVLMTIMLLMGSVCLAQEVKKDSIWGLEVKVTSTEINYLYSNTNIKAEFYSNIKIEDVYKLWCTYDNAYAYQNLNSVDKKNQSKSECTRINDSICLIKFEWEMETYKNIVSSLEVKLLLKDGTESNKLVYEISDVASLNKIESNDNYDIYYYDILGNPCGSGKGVRIKHLYKDGHLYAVRKVLM